MKKFILTAFFCLSLLLPTLAQAEEKTIIIGTNATWPPMEFINDKQEIDGVTVDYMKAVAKEAGFKVEFKDVDWNGIFAGLATGNYDAICASVTITPEREKQVDFTIPYFSVNQAIIVAANSDIKTMEALKNKEAGSQINTTGNFAIEKFTNINSRTYANVGLAVEDLLLGRLDAVVCDDAVAANILLSNPKYKKGLKISAIIEGDESEQYGVAVVKGNKEVLDLLNKGIKAVQDKGLDQEIFNKWIPKN